MKKLLIVFVLMLTLLLAGCTESCDINDNGYCSMCDVFPDDPTCPTEALLYEETATIESAYDMILAKYENNTLGTEFTDEIEIMMDGYLDYLEIAENADNERFLIAWAKLETLIEFVEEEGY